MTEREVMDLLNAPDPAKHETVGFDAVVQTPTGERFIVSYIDWSFERKQLVFVANGWPSEKVVA